MPSRSMLIAALALFAAVGGTATAARLIDGRDIRDRSLSTRELSKSAVKSLRRGETKPVTGARIVDGSITGSDLAPSSVGNDQVVDRSLTAGSLVADTLTATEIGVGAVGEEELAANSVGNSELKGDSISRNLVRNNAVGSAEVLDGDLRAADVGRVAGTLTGVDLPTIAGGSCGQADLAGQTYSIASGALSGAILLVGTPGNLPDGLLVNLRSPDGTNLRLQLCNPTGAAIDPPAADFGFVAIAI